MDLTIDEVRALALGEPDEDGVLTAVSTYDPRDAVAALDRDIAEEQEFDALRAGYLATRPRAITTERGA